MSGFNEWFELRKRDRMPLFYGLVLPLLLCLVLALYVKTASAEEVVLTWTNPTEQESCTNAGPLTTLAGTRIWQLVGEINSPDITTFSIAGLLPGDYTFAATAVDDTGATSRLSGTTTKTVATFTAKAGATAYQVVTISNGFWLLPVGTVSAETACIVTQQVNGHYAIPTSAVSWSPGTTVRPVLIVASCA